MCNDDVNAPEVLHLESAHEFSIRSFRHYKIEVCSHSLRNEKGYPVNPNVLSPRRLDHKKK